MKNKERLLKTLNIQPDSEARTPAVMPKSGPGALMSQQKMAAELNTANKTIEILKNKLIPIDSLIEITGRRRKLRPQEYEELKINLASNPLIHPIIVRDAGRGNYEIVAGHNRVDIYRELGRKEIEADIRDIRDEDVFAASFFSNLLNTNLTDYERFEGLKRIKTENNYSQTQLASSSGYSESRISNLFSFDKLSSEAKEILKDHPYVLGHNQVAKIVKGDHTRIVAGLKKLVEGSIQTEAQFVKFVFNKEDSKLDYDHQVFKIGKKVYAELTTRRDVVSIKIKDPTEVDKIKNKIESLLAEITKDTH